MAFALCLAAGGVAEGMAQNVPAPANSALEEVMVTARRREESLQDTPLAVTALTSEGLERQQIFGTEDLSRVTPNLQFTSYGPLTGSNAAAQVFIRGIGQTDASSGVDPGVGLYIDDVYLGRAVGGAMEFRDVANVQVLRGPQGTLFGRNTIGGAVLMSTVTPGDEFGGTIRAGIGDDNLYELFAAVDLPLADNLAARVSLGTKQRDGYVKRIHDGIDLGDDDTTTFQASLRWEPTDALRIVLRADHTEEDENGSPFVFKAINGSQAFPAASSAGAGCPGATFPPPSVPANAVDPRCLNDATWDLGKDKNGGTAPASSTLRNWGTSAHIEWEVSDLLTLKSITAYRELEWHGRRDADNTPLLVLHTDYQSDGHQFSQEFQALFSMERLNGVFGAYWFEESVVDFVLVPIAAPPPRVAAGGPGSMDYQKATIDNENWAVFTQWTYDLTDKLSLTAGIRHTEETKGIELVSFTIDDPAAPGLIPGIPATLPTTVGAVSNTLFIHPRPFEEDFTATTGSATISYRWNDSLMTYFSWSEGFKSGGFNQRYNAAPPGNVPVSFDAEEAETFELGFKADIGHAWRVNGAVFQTDYDNMQLIYRAGVAPLLFNAGKSSIDGAELEFTFAPNDRLIIEGSLGYLDDAFEELAPITLPGTPVTATVSPSNTLPFTPDWQASLSISYVFRLGGSLELTPRLNISYTDEQYFDAANSAEVAQLDEVTLYNASVKLADIGAGWSVTAGVNNLTDEDYYVAGNSSFSTSAGYAEVIYARPRNYFLRLDYNFGGRR
ncbi:MAG: TonB-dependent receptor [Spongiibacteraceae bacterium]|nr:TonB-dependent receptor [Spongiibacteraceae bacterium]